MMGDDPWMEKGIVPNNLYRIFNYCSLCPLFHTRSLLCHVSYINQIKTFLNLIRTSDNMWQGYRRNYVGLHCVLSLNSAYLNAHFHGCPNYSLQVFHLLLVKVRVPWNYIWNKKLEKDFDKNFTPTLPFLPCYL